MRGRVKAVGLVLLGLLLVALAVGAPDEATGALEPNGTGPEGAKGLVLVLEELGADVDVVRGAPAGAASTAVVLRDLLTDRDARAMLAWVADGGVLLLADGSGALASEPTIGDAEHGPCPAAFDGVDSLDFGPDGTVNRDDGFGGACFGGTVRVAYVGRGSIVVVDRPDPLTNDLLDEADNAVFAAAVLAPRAPAEVAFVVGPSAVVGDGDETLVDLVDRRVWEGLAGAVVALLVWVAWRARRLGRPVVEEQPVPIAGSELVVAVGRLLDARRRPDEAADVLRADVRRAVAARLGLAADAGSLAAAVATRTDLDVERVAAALGDRAVATDEDLLAVAADLDRIRTDVLGSRTT